MVGCHRWLELSDVPLIVALIMVAIAAPARAADLLILIAVSAAISARTEQDETQEHILRGYDTGAFDLLFKPIDP